MDAFTHEQTGLKVEIVISIYPPESRWSKYTHYHIQHNFVLWLITKMFQWLTTLQIFAFKIQLNAMLRFSFGCFHWWLQSTKVQLRKDWNISKKKGCNGNIQFPSVAYVQSCTSLFLSGTFHLAVSNPVVLCWFM